MIDRSINHSINQSFLPLSVKMNCYKEVTKIHTNVGNEWINGVGKGPADLARREPRVSGGFGRHVESSKLV
jgi:hypothetical protein